MKRILRIALGTLLLLSVAGACSHRTPETETAAADEPPQHILYSINADNYRTETAEIRSGETLGRILNSTGVPAAP